MLYRTRQTKHCHHCVRPFAPPALTVERERSGCQHLVCWRQRIARKVAVQLCFGLNVASFGNAAVSACLCGVTISRATSTVHLLMTPLPQNKFTGRLGVVISITDAALTATGNWCE